MELEWEESRMWPNTHYCGGNSPGNLELVNRTWVWTLYATDERPALKVDFGADLDVAKRCVEAMIRLEG